MFLDVGHVWLAVWVLLLHLGVVQQRDALPRLDGLKSGVRGEGLGLGVKVRVGVGAGFGQRYLDGSAEGIKVAMVAQVPHLVRARASVRARVRSWSEGWDQRKREGPVPHTSPGFPSREIMHDTGSAGSMIGAVALRPPSSRCTPPPSVPSPSSPLPPRPRCSERLWVRHRARTRRGLVWWMPICVRAAAPTVRHLVKGVWLLRACGIIVGV